MTDFVHLHLHSEYSLLDGACRIKRLVSHVAELGQSAVAVTDHGVMFGAIEFYNEAKKAGIKPIIGCEVYVAPRRRTDRVHGIDSKPFHLILLCENNEGYKNLVKLVSLGYTEGFYGKPRVDTELLEKYHNGLICLSACVAGELPRKILDGDFEGAKQCALWYKQIFGENNYYIEVQNHGIDEEKRVLPHLYKLARETGIGLCATNDAHYISREDSKMQDVLLCIQTGTRVGEPNGINFETDEFYVKSGGEMLALFKAVPQAVHNSVEIARRCNVDFEFGVIKLPSFDNGTDEDNEVFFRRLCLEGLSRLYGASAEGNISERFEYEYRIITKMGYTDYFLIVWDYINFARKNNIPVGPGRGSGAGSLCAYCIGITGIDPIKYNLLFERFLNPERVSMPDFDVDFCIEGRQRVIEYVRSRYGSDRVVQIGAFDTLKARAAIRDAGRVTGVAYGVCDKAAKLIPRRPDATIEEALAEEKQLSELYESDAEIHGLIDIASKIEGMPRHVTTHAAGVIIAASPVSDFVPLMKNDEAIITQYEMSDIESLGLLKMDFLGLRNLTVIRDCVNEIRKYESDFDINTISTDSAEVYEMLAKGRTQGVFQFESAGMRSLLMSLVPKTLEDLIAAISLYRPGPMEADAIPKYIANRRRPWQIKYKTPLLKNILDVTFGCILYQEQVMEICRVLAGYTYGRADLVRRAMGKKKHDVMERERGSFITGASENGVDRQTAEELFNEMSGFASYAFNKSHAAAYAYLAYQTAYLKCFYFGDYMASLMTSVLSDSGKLNAYISECEANGLKLLKPDINQSYMGFTNSEGIRFGLLAIKNLGRGVIQSIISEREKGGEFTDFADFCERSSRIGINKRAVECLIKAGALDCLGSNRHTMLVNYEELINGAARDSEKLIEGQLSLFGTENPFSPQPRFVDELPYDILLQMEKEVTGMYVSGHPILKYKNLRRLMKLPEISELSEQSSSAGSLSDGSPVSLFASVAEIKKIMTKSGGRMCILTLEDNTDRLECVVFPRLYEQLGQGLAEGRIILVSGKISVKDGSGDGDERETSILADRIRFENEIEDYFVRKRLCVRTESGCKEQIGTLTEFCRKSPGSVPLSFFFSDLRREVRPKSVSGVKITEDFARGLLEITGEENIALIAAKKPES